ncbi:CLUMA_CG009266, isoform A [Clunio marinus]|uniref:CLUMA_CG009266, isoform A n=1 Tax=Clunio marinus TaxID=568069 RepID=A0A1J1IA28_9DIPT|nr:CLUMA_CG009266, isoform A [Clunio marinus]
MFCFKNIPEIPSHRRTQFYLREEDGAYNYGYDSGSGMSAQEKSTNNHEVEGSYSYKTPEGKTVTVYYTADEKGYHPKTTIENAPSKVETKNAKSEESLKNEENLKKLQALFIPPQEFPAQNNRQHQKNIEEMKTSENEFKNEMKNNEESTYEAKILPWPSPPDVPPLPTIIPLPKHFLSSSGSLESNEGNSEEIFPYSETTDDRESNDFISKFFDTLSQSSQESEFNNSSEQRNNETNQEFSLENDAQSRPEPSDISNNNEDDFTLQTEDENSRQQFEIDNRENENFEQNPENFDFNSLVNSFDENVPSWVRILPESESIHNIPDQISLLDRWQLARFLAFPNRNRSFRLDKFLHPTYTIITPSNRLIKTLVYRPEIAVIVGYFPPKHSGMHGYIYDTQS